MSEPDYCMPAGVIGKLVEARQRPEHWKHDFRLIVRRQHGGPMPENGGIHPPVACRWLIWLASWIVPGRARPQWIARWNAGLLSWCVLVERGELTRNAKKQVKLYAWSAFADSFWVRFSREQVQHIVRGPAFVLAGATAIVLLTGALTRGFSATRHLVELVRTVNFGVPRGSPWNDAAQSTLILHSFPIAFALIIGIVLITVQQSSLPGRGFKYWSFFALKTIGVLAILPVLWIEAGVAIRSLSQVPQIRALIGGLLLTLVFIFAFGCSIRWCFADQRRRCPVCLKRLSMPVTIGSWSSVLEPVTTELVCDEGHGSLCVPETEAGERDRWTKLDPSWQDLFETRSR